MLKIGMDKSSLHSFTARLVYNDGHELTSPRIELARAFLRRYVTYCARRLSFAAMNGAACLFANGLMGA